MGTTSSSSTSESYSKGKKVIDSKLKAAARTGVLNMSNMDLKPRSHVWSSLSADPPGIGLHLKTLDLSENNLKNMPREIFFMANLKTLNLSKCNMQRTFPIDVLDKLTHLKLNNNDLETDTSDTESADRLAALPVSLIQFDLSCNHYIQLPAALLTLTNLVELNLSSNRLATIKGIGHLVSLVELFLDDNNLVEIPDEVGLLTKLRFISLKSNKIGKDAPYQPPEPPRQSISVALFTDTLVVNIDLTGNPIRKMDIMKFDGVDAFLQRRKLAKDKSFAGGATTDNSLFGLD